MIFVTMPPQRISEQSVNRVALASLVGATIEWYDFFLYGVVAGIVFSKLYFPANDPFVSTMLAYATFAVGFVARPLGGIIFGHFGDRIGRKSMLVMTLIIMGAATTAIGFLPTYEQIGVLAPQLLLILRILQGIGLGGEWGGAVLMTYEYAPQEKRGFYASIPQIGLALGLCLASGVVGLMSMTLSDAAFLAWGWRLAFLFSVALLGVGVYIRLTIMETPDFQNAKSRRALARVPFFDMLNRNMTEVFLGMGARLIDGVFFNIFAVFSIGYLVNTVGLNRSLALWAVSAAALTMIFAIPLFGALADRLGRPKTYAYGSLLLGLSVFPAFIALDSGNVTVIYISMIIAFGIIYSMCYGPEASLFADLFDTRVRYTGISFVYQFSGIFASGITPMIATYLFEKNDHQPWLICAYVVFAALISTVSAIAIERRLLARK